MNGIEKAKLQSARGIRSIVEEIDALRISFGNDKITVLTPIVETKLRSGLLASKTLQLSCIFSDLENLNIILSFPTGYPENPVEGYLKIDNSNYESDLNKLLLKLMHSNNENINSVHIVKSIIKDYQNNISSEMHNECIQVIENSTDLHEENFDKINDANLDDNANELYHFKEVVNSCYYSCKMCGNRLFDDRDLNSHSIINNVSCSSYYLNEVPHWLILSNSDISGKINCNKCDAKIGNWSWAGNKCSCNSWIVPLFQFIKSKVDKKRYFIS